MRRTLALLTVSVCLFALPLSATERGVKRVETYATADRHALVIGNSEYEQVGRLRNPVNDADAMTDSLQSLGPTAASSQAKSSRKKYLKSMTFLCSADIPPNNPLLRILHVHGDKYIQYKQKGDS